tara:strand:+ start:1910 stop:2398 length:489 start_codon:yes stop_codon:yes gene_type:complete
MALTGKKYENFYVTTGSGADKVVADDLTKVSAAWAVEKAEGCKKYVNDPILSPIVFQLQQMQDEIDYLRTEISTNKDKTSMALGTSGTTALAGDTALLALGTSGSTALAGNTNIVTIGSSTTIAFGDMITITDPKSGKVIGYNIVMSVVNGGVTKTVKLTLV